MVSTAKEKSNYLVYVPNGDRVLHIMEGTGDNLLPEDRKEGYVDYINYEVFRVGFEDQEPALIDDCGGMVMLPKMYSEYKEHELTRMVLDMEGFGGIAWCIE